MSDLKTLGRVSPSGKYIIETWIPLQGFFQEISTGLRDRDQYPLVITLRSGEERGENSNVVMWILIDNKWWVWLLK